MADEEEKNESMPTVPVDPNRWISVLVLPAELLSGTSRNLTRLAALATLIIGAVLTAGALLIWIPLGIGLGIVFSLIAWGIFRLSRAGLARRRLSADSDQGEQLLNIAPQLRKHASRRKVREWIAKLQTALPTGSIVRLCYQTPSQLRAFSAPFEPFPVNQPPDWMHSEFEEGNSVDIDEIVEVEQAKRPAQSSVRRLLGRIGNTAVGVFSMTLLLAFLAFILGLIGYLAWLSFIAIVDFVVYRKPPKFPLIIYLFGTMIGIIAVYNYLLSFRQIWMVPGGFVRRISRPWRRHWDVELFRQNDCTFVLDETIEKFGSYVHSHNRMIKVDFGVIGPLGSLSALLSPVPPPELSELSDLC